MMAVKKTVCCSFNFGFISQQQLEGSNQQKHTNMAATPLKHGEKKIQVFEATAIARDEQP